MAADNIPDAVNQQLPVNLRNVLDFFGLLDGFSGNGSRVIVDSRGNITLTGKDIAGFSVDSGLIDTSSASGDAGEITLIANDTISIANSFIFSNTSGSGKGGDIDIGARSVSLTDGSLVSASTFGEGPGGDITVDATDSVDLAGSGLLTATTANGDTGAVSIKTGRLTVQDESAIATLSIGDGDARNLNIDVEQLTVRDGIVTSSTVSGEDFGGELGEGLAGNLLVNASDSVALTSTVPNDEILLELPIPGFDFPQIDVPIGLFALSQSQGNAGSLSINTGRLIVQGGATASTATWDQGLGGNLTVNATDFVELLGVSGDTENPSGLIAETSGSGEGGDIRINTPRLIIRDGAVISTATGRVNDNNPERTGNAGNLTVTADLVELSGVSANPILRGGLVSGSAGFGDAGNVLIDTEKLIVRDGGCNRIFYCPTGQWGQLNCEC